MTKCAALEIEALDHIIYGIGSSTNSHKNFNDSSLECGLMLYN